MFYFLCFVEWVVVFDLVYCNSLFCVLLCFILVSGCLFICIGVWDNVVDFVVDIFIYVYYLCNFGYCMVLLGKMYFCGFDQLYGYEECLISDIYLVDYGWVVNWDELEVCLSWYYNMFLVLQVGFCVCINQLDFDEEVVFKVCQYFYDYVCQYVGQLFCLIVLMIYLYDFYSILVSYWNFYCDEDILLLCQCFVQEEQDFYL